MKLRELQLRFLGALRDPSRDPAVLGELEGTASDGAARLRVYRRSMIGSLLDALTAAYPVCRALVGTSFFEEMARQYVEENPSRTADLHEYGHFMPEFLGSVPSALELIYLPDMARLEWAWHRAQLTTGLFEVDLDPLRELPPDRYPDLRFRPAPSLWTLRSPWPLARIWEVNQPTWEGSQEVDLDQGGGMVVVWCHRGEVRMEHVTETTDALLEELLTGRPLGELPDELVPVLKDELSLALSRGWVVPVYSTTTR